MLGIALVFAQLAITAQAPDTVIAGAPFTLVIEVTASGEGLPRVTLPDLAPFDREGLRTGSRSGRSPMSGPWVTGEYRLVLRTDRTGTHVIPPVEARIGNQWARSRPVTIVVRSAAGSAPEPPAVLAAARIDTTELVSFHVMLVPDTVFVGQQATYQVGLFVEERARSRLRRNPEFIAPEMRGMLAYDLPLARSRLPQRVAGSRRYDAHVYERAVFPLHAGRHVIPPARLIYSLPQTNSFFSREESHELLSEPVVLIVQEPPVAGRPDDFTGVVGDVRIGARFDSADVRAGDPMTLTVRVSGEGNVKFFQRPSIEIPWGDLVPANERVELDSTLPMVRGAKEFDWILTPRVAGELELPAFRYSYFDPSSGQYETALTEPDTLTVLPGSLARETPQSSRRPALPIRAVDRGAIAGPTHDTPLFRMLMLLAPLPALSMLLVRRRPRRRIERRSPLRILRDLARLQRAADVRQIRRAYLAALAERLGLPPMTLGRRGGLARTLRRAGVSADVATAAEHLLQELDAAAYSPTAGADADVARRAEATVVAVGREARPVESLRDGLPLAGLLLAALAFATPLAAQAPPPTAFARGVEAYAERRYLDARREFAAAAERTPRSADAWANYATASFALGDTAAAVLGWQRALRLEPGASDARSRLEGIRQLPPTDPAWVPPAPRWLLPGLAGILWLIAWGALAVRIRGGARWARDWAVAAGTMAVLAGGAAWEAERRIAGRDLNVVAEDGALRTLPALAAERSALASVGEVGRIDQRGGEWARLVLPDGREGWIERQRLLPIALP